MGKNNINMQNYSTLIKYVNAVFPIFSLALRPTVLYLSHYALRATPYALRLTLFTSYFLVPSKYCW